MSEKKLPTVREHAKEIIKGLEAKAVTDSKTAVPATGIPEFSAGTTATKSVEDIQPPEFAAKRVALPEGYGTPKPGPAEGGPKGDVQAADAAPKTEEAPKPTIKPTDAPQAQEDAEKVAEAIADRFAEYEEFEYEDPDLGEKIPLRAPKQYANSAKRGYSRRSTFDREMHYLKDLDPVFRQLALNGQLKNGSEIANIVQQALNDQEYGTYVTGGFRRRQAGLPLVEQAMREAKAAVPSPAAPTEEIAIDDPFIAQAVQPLMAKIAALQQRTDTWEQSQEKQRQEVAQKQQRDVWINEQWRGAHADLTAEFPDLFTGDINRDRTTLEQTRKFAEDAGYTNLYGLRGAIVLAGQRVHQIHQDRLAATASPSAMALQAAEGKHLELARREAAVSARTVGSGAPTPAAPPKPKPKPSGKNADGTPKPRHIVLAELGEWITENQKFAQTA